MGLLGEGDRLPSRPVRVLVAGTSGSGKTTLAHRISAALGIRHVEIDALFHGPNWIPRATFVDDVRRFSAEPGWVTEWQCHQVRHLLAERADTLVWLDLPRWTVMPRVVRRTVRRWRRHEQLWNDNIEPPLWTILTDPEHIVRWAWATHPHTRSRVLAALDARPELVVVQLTSQRAVEDWVTGPLRDAAAST